MKKYTFSDRCQIQLQVLEEAGIMKKIKRVAGASVGAMIASLVALGFTSQDLKEFMDQDLRKILVGKRKLDFDQFSIQT